MNNSSADTVIGKIKQYTIPCFVVLFLCVVSVGLLFVEAGERKNDFSVTEEEMEEASVRIKKISELMSDDGKLILESGEIFDIRNVEGIKSIEFYKMAHGITSDDTVDEIVDEAVEEVDDDAFQDTLEDLESTEEKTHSVPDKNDWRLILVNKQNPVPDGYEAVLASINDSQQADERIIDDLYSMLEAANADEINLLICSAYRSYDRQTTLFNNKINKLMSQGMSYMEAYSVGSMSVTVPGTSEHQLGLALDILTSDYLEMDDGFGETEAGKWLAVNAPLYGFILRYPQGKEAITGIIYEPWHFRYVGREYSSEITELGVTLEEYLNGAY